MGPCSFCRRNYGSFYQNLEVDGGVAARETHSRARKGDSCLTLGSALSKETHALTKQEASLGRGHGAKSRRVRTALLHDLGLGYYGDGIRFQIVCGQSL